MHVGLSEFLQVKHDTVSVVRGRPDLVCANFTVLSSADSNLITMLPILIMLVHTQLYMVTDNVYCHSKIIYCNDKSTLLFNSG